MREGQRQKSMFLISLCVCFKFKKEECIGEINQINKNI